MLARASPRLAAALLLRPLQQLQAAPLLQLNQVRFLDSHSGTGGGIPGVGGARGLVGGCQGPGWVRLNTVAKPNEHSALAQ